MIVDFVQDVKMNHYYYVGQSGFSPGGAWLSIARSPLLFGFAPLVAEVVVDDRVVRLLFAHHLLDLHTWKPQV